MAEPLAEPAAPEAWVDPGAVQAGLARKNLAWGWALFGLFCLLFAGTILVALGYLWLD